MPLTAERPGLFRGRGWVGRGWFVVDPARDLEPLVAEWRENFAARNEPLEKRAARWAVGVASYLGLLGILAVGIWAARNTPFLFYPGIVISTLIGLAGLLGAAILADAIVPSPPFRRPRVPGVVRVDERVARWATGTTSIEDIWDVSVAMDRFQQVLTAEVAWTTGWDWEDGDRPDELVEDVISPVLIVQKTQEAQRLVRVAERVGFQLPPHLQREVTDGS
jgi:hypothetical protein